MRKVLLLLSLFLTSQVAFGQKSLLKNFPENADPKVVGDLLSNRITYADYMIYGSTVHYAMVCYWNGALGYAERSKDKLLMDHLVAKFDNLVEVDKHRLPPKNHVDHNMFGSLAFEYYKVTGNKKYLEMGLSYADTQWDVPANANATEKEWADKGYSWQTRLWIDDMYMITIVQTRAYEHTKDMKYLDRAAKEMVLYLDELQRPNGLFYHAPDAPHYWARGNGWMAVGMTELLHYLPKKHEHYNRIMEGYQTMMKSLLEYQSPSGMWNQLIDQPDFWPETSGTGMFTYAFIMGVKNGWLDAKLYAPAARKAWIAMQDYVDIKGAVREVCIGTGKNKSQKFYYDRPRHTGDHHGQAPYLWCVNALMD